MQFTLFELKNMEPVLARIMESKVLSIRPAYRFSKFLKIVSKELTILEETRQSLVMKYGSLDPETQTTQVTEDNKTQFLAELNEVLREEVEINFQLIELGDLENLQLSPADIIAIERLIAEPEV